MISLKVPTVKKGQGERKTNGRGLRVPHGSNGSISMTIAVMSMEQGSIVTSPMEKSAD
jgi:hypothetical protein